jgi:hypothetical protein
VQRALRRTAVRSPSCRALVMIAVSFALELAVLLWTLSAAMISVLRNSL